MELSFLLKYCYCSCITIFIVHKMWSQLIYLAVYAYCLQTSYTYDVWICLQACTPQPVPYCQGCRTPSFREDNLSQVRNWPPEWSVYNHLYYVTYMYLMHNLILIAYLEILTLRFLCTVELCVMWLHSFLISYHLWICQYMYIPVFLYLLNHNSTFSAIK